jgi:Flp pilus assembly protein TadG
MPSERRGSTANRDRGAVAVETAFISVFLVTLLFGIIDASFLFKDGLTVSSAARAGARMGASQPKSLSFAQDSADQVTNSISGLAQASRDTIEVWVYEADASLVNGRPSAGICPSACVKYNWPNGATKLTYLSGSWASTHQNACNGDSRHNSLGVYVKYQHSSPVGFFFKNVTVSESTVMFLEPVPSALDCLATT